MDDNGTLASTSQATGGAMGGMPITVTPLPTAANRFPLPLLQPNPAPQPSFPTTGAVAFAPPPVTCPAISQSEGCVFSFALG